MTRTSTEAITSYVTDMLALEHHIDKALTGQIERLQHDEGGVSTMLRTFRGSIATHIAHLQGLVTQDDASAGAHVADILKSAVASVAGVGAAVIDAVRTETVPKDLRDDYAAFGLATVGYVMLHSVATSLGDTATATVAEMNLRDYARMTMELNDAVPGAVIRFLSEEGLPARADVLPSLLEAHHEVWHTSGARQHAGAHQA
jgi:ferritin-like metal-binding protein YciE